MQSSTPSTISTGLSNDSAPCCSTPPAFRSASKASCEHELRGGAEGSEGEVVSRPPPCPQSLDGVHATLAGMYSTTPCMSLTFHPATALRNKVCISRASLAMRKCPGSGSPSVQQWVGRVLCAAVLEHTCVSHYPAWWPSARAACNAVFSVELAGCCCCCCCCCLLPRSQGMSMPHVPRMGIRQAHTLSAGEAMVLVPAGGCKELILGLCCKPL
jgi:hypothetical protein